MTISQWSVITLLVCVAALLANACNRSEASLSGHWIVVSTELYSDDYFELQKKRHLIDSAFFDFQMKGNKQSIGPRILYTFKEDSIKILTCNSSLYYVCDTSPTLILIQNKDSIAIRNPESSESVSFKIQFRSRDKLVLTTDKFYDFGKSEHTLLRTPKADTFISSQSVLSFLTASTIYQGIDDTPISFMLENNFGHFRRNDLNIEEADSTGEFLVLNIGSQCYFIIEESIYKVMSLFERDYLMAQNRWDEVFTLYEKMKNAGEMSNGYVNHFCWQVYKDCDDQEVVKRCIGWMKEVTDEEPAFDYLDTYAYLLYKAGNNAAAKEIAQLAIEAGKTDERNTKGLEKLITEL